MPPLSPEWLSGFFCALLRGAGLAALLPLGSLTDSVLQRLTITFGLGLLFAGEAAPAALDSATLLGEVLAGVCIALPWVLLVEAGGMLGELIDNGRGQNIAALYDPLSDVQHAGLAILLKSYVWMMLLLSGAAERMLQAMQYSYLAAPGGGVLNGHVAEAALRMLGLLQASFTGMLSFFLPFSLIFLAAEAAVGFVTKGIGQANLNSEAFQLKSFLTMLLLSSLAIYGWSEGILGYCEGWVELLLK